MDKKIISDIQLKKNFLDKQKSKYKNIKDIDKNIIFSDSQYINREKYINCLNSVNQLFLRKFQIDLSNFIGSNEIIFNCTNIKNISYQEYIKNFNMPVKFNILESMSNEKIAFIGFSSQFIFLIIDLLFGNKGSIPSFVLDKCEFTTYEYSVIKRLYSIMIESYVFAWKKKYLVDLKYIYNDNMYINTDLIGCSDDSNLFCSEFIVNINNNNIKFNICISLSILDKFKQNLLNKKKINQNINSVINYDLLNIVNKIELEIQVKFEKFILPLSDVTKLKIGDILNISQPDQVMSYVDDIFLFSGKYGLHNGKHAFSIIDIIKN